MHALTLVVAVVAAGFPETLTHPLLAKAERWTWPGKERFEAAWAAQPESVPGEVLVRGSLAGVPEGAVRGWFLVDEEAGRVTLAPLVTDGDSNRLRYARWTVEPVDGPEWSVEGGGRLTVEERLASPLAREELVAWTYATTLQASSGPLYTVDVGAAREAPRARKGAVAGTARERPADPDAIVTELGGDLKKVRAWARKEKGNDALYTAFQAYRPMGQCSMDTRPQEAARVYAELAFERGDLGRFLQLQVRIMGDRFDRVAWSSYGEAAHGTEAERLISTGIDVDQFLLGLLVARPGEPVGLGPWRLARSIREAGREGTVGPMLKARAQAPGADPFNRLRALQTWVFLEAGQPHGLGLGVEPGPALKEAAGLDVGPLGQAWVAQEQRALAARQGP